MDSSKQAGDLKEPLKDKSAAAAPFHSGSSSLDRFLSKLISCLPYISFCFMAYSAVTAIYDSKNDPANLAFVAGSFTLLGLLYFSMWVFERTNPHGDVSIDRWIFCLLNLSFSFTANAVTAACYPKKDPVVNLFLNFVGLMMNTWLLYWYFSPGAKRVLQEKPWMMEVLPIFLPVALFFSAAALM